MTCDEIKTLVRTVPDFPAPGIQFRDLTTLIADRRGFSAAIDYLVEAAPPELEAVAGIEARGFIFGSGIAARLGLGFVMLRKAGKLPLETIACDYAPEYADGRLELDPRSVRAGEKVLLVDDLLATGGTALAGARLLRDAGAVCEHALFVIDLPDLGGAAALREDGICPCSLFEFSGR